MMSGWLKVGAGYIPKKTINIHPGPTWVNTQGGQSFAGAGMYGHYVHEAILSAYVRGDISHTEVTIHAVTDLPDGGAPIARIPVLLCPDDTAETIAQRVNKEEHAWQPLVMEAWLNGKIQVSEDGLHVIYSPFPH
jgi:folate-dependent phosphoribosylglycinamide formyltransferase PurN